MDIIVARDSLGCDAAPVRRSLGLVEDDALVAMMIGEMAVDIGWAMAWSANDEASAFALLDANTPPTVAVLDITLGLTTSFAVAAACRDRGIPVLFITGATAMQIPEGCGDDPILAKPFSPDDFQTALGRCLDRKEILPAN